jgi:hypothetical protein
MTGSKKPPGTASECRNCQAPIVWTRTEKGKAMPCDVAPSSDGTFFLFRRPDNIEAVYVHSDSDTARKARQRDQNTHHSHFKTCPRRKDARCSE